MHRSGLTTIRVDDFRRFSTNRQPTASLPPAESAATDGTDGNKANQDHRNEDNYGPAIRKNASNDQQQPDNESNQDGNEHLKVSCFSHSRYL